MRKIILKISLLLTFIVLFTISVFAFTVPSEYDGTKYGANYDTSHESNDCCPYPEASSVPADSHYEKGYSDGFLDGYQSGLESDELSEEQKQTFLNEFLASGAYAQLIEQAIEDYKNSIEFHAELMAAYENGYIVGQEEYKGSKQYQDLLFNQYQNGITDGYALGYNTGYGEATDIQYNKGVAEGFANFRETSEYRTVLQSQYDGGYVVGYADCADDVEIAQGPEWSSLSSVITLLLSFIVLISLIIFLFTFKKKKRGKRK